ncbi:MAG: InlB B-repeat-containing protein [Clostridia bacterium]|nr:InlB B-repeat-containing protein [Clostridia bacterium]
MRRAVSLVISFVLLLSTSFGYTLTINTERGITTREVEAEKNITVGLSDRAPAKYVVNSENVVLRIFGNRRQLVMPTGNVDISVNRLYTVNFNSNGGSTVKSIKVAVGDLYGTLPVPTKSGYAFDGWYMEEWLVTKITDTTVVETASDHTLYAKWKEATAENLMEVGDYVTYYPTITTCDLTTITGVEQTEFDPSATTTWRVLSNDGTTVELVSADSVGDLTLGKDSEQATDGTFSSGTEADMEVAKSNYARAVKILNEISEAYVNPTLATGGRGLGTVVGSSMEEIDTTTYPLTWDYTYPQGYTYTEGNNGFPHTDTYYSTDVNVLMNNSMLHSSGYVWLASRNLGLASSNSDFRVRSMITSGDIYNYYTLFSSHSDGSAITYSNTNGVRPVVILKSGLTISGAGTEENPWQFTN